jgi:hypothetical protein
VALFASAYTSCGIHRDEDTMNNTDTSILEVDNDTHTTQFARGLLLSPAEVEYVAQDHDPMTRQQVKGHWFLCGHCSPAMFDHIIKQQGTQLKHDLSLYTFGGNNLGAGATFLLLTQYFEGAQHRFLLPIWDPRVPAFLQAIEAGLFSVLLARQGDERATILTSGAVAAVTELLAYRTQPTQAQLSELLAGLPGVLEQAASPALDAEACESYQGAQELRDVSLSVVIEALVPDAMRQEALQRQAQQQQATPQEAMLATTSSSWLH